MHNLTKATNVRNYSPVGVIDAPFDPAGFVGPSGSESAPADGRSYTVRGADLLLSVAGGQGGRVVLRGLVRFAHSLCLWAGGTVSGRSMAAIFFNMARGLRDRVCLSERRAVVAASRRWAIASSAGLLFPGAGPHCSQALTLQPTPRRILVNTNPKQKGAEIDAHSSSAGPAKRP